MATAIHHGVLLVLREAAFERMINKAIPESAATRRNESLLLPKGILLIESPEALTA